MTGALSPARLVLEGVPRVEFYRGGPRCPEDVPWPACLRAVLDYAGDGFGCRKMRQCGNDWNTTCSYAQLMAASGAAFRLNWKPGWHCDNVSTRFLGGGESAVYRHTLDVIGYDCELADGSEGEAHLLSRIADSLRRRMPVIARGVVGPPEECIVTGYDGGGETLIGWSFFQSFPPFDDGLEFEPAGYFRKRNWFAAIDTVVIPARKRERPAMKEALAKTLAWALDTVLTPLTCGRHNGLAAYSAWADHLLLDDEIARSPAISFEVHDDAVGTVAEGRWYASVYLGDMVHCAERIASHLLAAASCYAREHELMWEIWSSVGGNGRDPDKARRFADPAVRRQIVPIIREARACDAEAAGHLQRALAGLG